MYFITTQPDSDYYIWQLQVQLNNIKKFGSEEKCLIIFGYNKEIGINPNAIEFQKKTKARVLFYPDNRDLSSRLYVPSIRPHLLKQLYKNDLNLILNRNFFYLDCDIIISDYPKFNKIDDERYIHVSDTSSQFCFDTMIKRDYELFKNMCSAVGINPFVVKKNKHNGGGITYFFKRFNYLDYEFWDKVERDSVSLYKMMLVSGNNYSSLEMLTANKWALLWNLWLIGYDTKVSSELSISWAKNPINDWYVNKLYNNAGVTESDREKFFLKTDFYVKSPFREDFSYVSPEFCSYKYVQEIIDTAESLNLIE